MHIKHAVYSFLFSVTSHQTLSSSFSPNQFLLDMRIQSVLSVLVLFTASISATKSIKDIDRGLSDEEQHQVDMLRLMVRNGKTLDREQSRRLTMLSVKERWQGAILEVPKPDLATGVCFTIFYQNNMISIFHPFLGILAVKEESNDPETTEEDDASVVSDRMVPKKKNKNNDYGYHKPNTPSGYWGDFVNEAKETDGAYTLDKNGMLFYHFLKGIS